MIFLVRHYNTRLIVGKPLQNVSHLQVVCFDKHLKN